MDFSPRFLRRYLNLAEDIDGAIRSYCEDVRSGDFPNESESYIVLEIDEGKDAATKGTNVHCHSMPKSVTERWELKLKPKMN